MGCNPKLICIVSVVVALMPTLSVWARSHWAKANTKAKKAKEQAKEIKEKISIEAKFYFRFRSVWMDLKRVLKDNVYADNFYLMNVAWPYISKFFNTEKFWFNFTPLSSCLPLVWWHILIN